MAKTLYATVLLFTAILLLSGRARAQNVYASQLVGNSTDFQNPERVADSSKVNYAHLTNLAGVLNTSYLRVRFPAQGKSGDAINITVRGTGQTLGLGLLTGTTVRLYDSAGAQVYMGSGSSLLNLSLLAPGEDIYAIRFITDVSQNFKFKEARIEFNNLLNVNVLNEFRVYNIFYTSSCPPVYADTLYDYKTGGLLTSYVSNPGNAADANPNNVATMVVPLNLLGLLPEAYLDLKFSKHARPGDYVGFTIGQASSLLSLSLIQNLTIRVYDQNNVLRETKNGFSLADLQLLAGTANRYTLGFMSQKGNYKIARLRISLGATVGVLQNLNVYNAFHYAIDRPPVTITVSGSSTLCQGQSVTLTAFDSLGSTNYYWSTGATTASINVSQPGTYSVQVTDTLSCTRYSIPIEIKVAPAVIPRIVGDSVLCAGRSGTLSTSSVYASYLWNGGSTAGSLNITGPGKYYVRVTDVNGCQGTDTINVITNNLNINPVVTAASCGNGSNGAIAATVSGGSGSYAYRWSNGNTGTSINSLVPGLYTLSVTDNVYGCVYNKAYTVTSDNTLTLKSSVVNTSACGKSDGSIALTVIGGSGNYVYSWTGGATTASLTGLPAGVYRIAVEDTATDCMAYDTIVVNAGNSGLNVGVTTTPATGCSKTDGSIVLNVTGGSGNYSYSWSNGSSSSSLNNIAGGNYYVTVTDNTTGCVAVKKVTLSAAGALTVAGTIAPTQCNRGTGAITANVTGGSGSYTYQWSTGATGNNIQNLMAGAYILAVTDNNTGCKGRGIFNVQESGGPVATLGITHPDCASNSNGGINITTTGTTYKYYWSNGSVLKNQSNLRPGTYVVTITDTVGGCSALYTASITPKSQVSLVAAPKSNTACPAAANGSVNVSVEGGVAPYAYNWSTGATSQNISGLSSGNYTLTVTDANGCSAFVSVPVVTDSTKLLKVMAGVITNATCNTALNGSATVTVSGGVAPYSYSWSNGAITQNLAGVMPGTYTLTVTDALGCNVQLPVTIGITNNNPLTVTLNNVTPAGCSANTGSVDINVSGGSAPYTYLWSNGATTQDLNGVGAGTYSVTVRDNNGCTEQRSETVPVSGPGTINVAINTITDATCNVSMDGGINITASGGVAPYTYKWSNGSAAEDLSGVNPGTYTITVTDANGCPGQNSAEVKINTTATLKVMVDSAQGAGCSGGTGASIFITASAGTLPYTYLWSNGATSADLLNIVPGNYTVTVTDAKGCVVVQAAQAGIDTAKSVMATVDSVQGAGCIGSNSGSIYITPTRGKLPYSYVWSNGTTSQNLLNAPAGNYTVTVTDAAGCSRMINAAIGVDPAKRIMAVADSAQGAGCATSASGNIYVSVSGGKPPYAYAWSNGSVAEDLLSVRPGSYTVTVTDANGCSMQFTDTVAVDTARSVKVMADVITGAGCIGSASGSITVQVMGGLMPYTYSWSDGSFNQNLVNVKPGSYTLTVTDAGGCTRQFDANVGVDTANRVKATVTTVTDTRCKESLSGSIDVSVSGGLPPYKYQWSNGAVSQDLTFVASGMYMLTVSDAAGCSAQTSANVGVSNANPVVLTLDSTNTIGCVDTMSGKIFVTTAGGEPPYTYLWSNGDIAEDLVNVGIGSYNLTATDNAGCKANIAATVDKPEALVVESEVKNVTCFGYNDGSISVTVKNGSGLYTYAWDNGVTSRTTGGLGGDTYALMVTDVQTQCIRRDSFTVKEYDSLRVNLIVTNDSCTFGNDGKISVDITGGLPPYNFNWSTGSSEQTIAGLAAGSYTLQVADNNSCFKTYTANVAQSECSDEIVVYDVITPNGDGANDFWVIKGLEMYPSNSVKVFNKWGDVVFEQNNYANNWSGIRGTGGDVLPDGTYFYLIKINDNAAGKKDFTGSMLIQR